MKYTAISADSHINEVQDLWEKRLPRKLKHRGPRLIEVENGGQGWVVEGSANPFNIGLNAVVYRAQKRYDRADYRKKFMEIKDGYAKPVRYEDILPGSYDPAARLREQDEDKVQAEVLYANPALWPMIKAGEDRELKLACFRAYNDWIAEYNAYSPDRLIGLGLVPVTGIEDAVAELKRCVEVLKLRGMALESYPSGAYTNPSPEDDRFWAVAEELGVPISLHITFTIPADFGKLAIKSAGDPVATLRNQGILFEAIDEGSYSQVLERLILAGVFERFPRLIFVGVEVQCGWIPYYLQRFDERYRRHWRDLPVRLDLLPSEYFRRNSKTTFIIDSLGVQNRYLVGVDNIMWSSDFPHSVSNWPIDVELGLAQLDEVNAPPDERDRIMWRTSADLYGLKYEEEAAV